MKKGYAAVRRSYFGDAYQDQAMFTFQNVKMWATSRSFFSSDLPDRCGMMSTSQDKLRTNVR